MTPGQIAYEADLAAAPLYDDGSHRVTWRDLDVLARWTWERKPSARVYASTLARAGLYHTARGAARKACACAAMLQGIEASA